MTDLPSFVYPEMPYAGFSPKLSNSAFTKLTDADFVMFTCLSAAMSYDHTFLSFQYRKYLPSGDRPNMRSWPFNTGARSPVLVFTRYTSFCCGFQSLM